MRLRSILSLVLLGCSSSSTPSSAGDVGGDAAGDVGGDAVDASSDVPVETASESSSDVGDADACAPTGPSDAACPPLIDVDAACPCGCFRTQPPQRWDPTRNCIEPPTDEICSNDGCATATDCWVRKDTGDLYFLFCIPISALYADGSPWQECTDAQKAAMGLYPPPPACP